MYDRRAALALLALLVLAGAWTHYFGVPRNVDTESDIHYDYLEARRVVAGENPYERILSGDMRTRSEVRHPFPALLPCYSAGVVKLGLQEFEPFVAFWRLAFLLFNAGAGAVLFYLLWPRRGLLLAVFGVLFWFFSRSNLKISVSVNFDYPAIFFLLLSFWLLPRHGVWAFLALGLSLGFKPLGVILVPLFLIVVWQSERQHRIRAVLIAGAVLASTLVVTSAPFLAANPEAFIKSMLFEVVRDPITQSPVSTVALWNSAWLIGRGVSPAVLRADCAGLCAVLAAQDRLIHRRAARGGRFHQLQPGVVPAILRLADALLSSGRLGSVSRERDDPPRGRRTPHRRDATSGRGTMGCRPAAGSRPPVTDKYTLPVRAGAGSDPYRIYVGMHDPATGTRLDTAG